MSVRVHTTGRSEAEEAEEAWVFFCSPEGARAEGSSMKGEEARDSVLACAVASVTGVVSRGAIAIPLLFGGIEGAFFLSVSATFFFVQKGR